MAIAALVLGIVGLCISFIPCLGMYGMPLTLLAILFGALGMRDRNNKGLAIAGLTCGIVGTLIAAWWLYAWISFKKAAERSMDDAVEHAKQESAKDKAARQAEKESEKQVDQDIAAPAAVPQACEDYKAAVESAMACEALGAGRDQMKAMLDKVESTWAKLPPEGMKAISDGCAASGKAIRDAIKVAGC